jgi:hypothetical protein
MESAAAAGTPTHSLRMTGGPADIGSLLDGLPNEAGYPRSAKVAQYPFMIAASCCCRAESAFGKAAAGRAIRYWISDAWAAP